MAKHDVSRRGFLQGAAYGLCAGSLGSHAWGESGQDGIPMRALGATGVNQ